MRQCHDDECPNPNQASDGQHAEGPSWHCPRWLLWKGYNPNPNPSSLVLVKQLQFPNPSLDPIVVGFYRKVATNLPAVT